MAYDPPAADPLSDVKDADVIAEARKRWEICDRAEADNRRRYREQLEFIAGSQWDERLKRAREAQMRPCLTMDRTTTHINQIVNDVRQNKPAIDVHPVDGQGDVDVAEVFDGLIRNIERVSNADAVYETAAFCQVAGGFGYWRILSKYVDDDAFDQELLLERVLDPLTVRMDPNAKEQDGSDARYCFIEASLARDELEERYPDAKPNEWPSAADSKGWWSDTTVRCVEYFRVIDKPTTIYMLDDGMVVDAARLRVIQAEIPGLAPVAQRQVRQRQVQWFKLGGNEVLDKRLWPSRWIGVVRVVGNEMVVDGKIRYSGHTERLMDPARAYNYWTSTVTETVALQPKAPFIGAKGQFKGVEARWQAANSSNPAYLEYEPVELNGQMLPPPARQTPPTVPTGAIQAMQLAAQDLQWISGQHASAFGAPSNERSGRAIVARQREGDTATYHYGDNLARSIRHTGRILVDMAPRVMDSARVLRVLGEDGKAKMVDYDPSLPQAKVEQQDENGAVRKIYNLGVGRYDVAVTVGPSFGTKRMEAVEAMTQLIQASPQLMQVVGDLYVREQDWPGAQKMADRLAKTIPPELQAGEMEDGGPDPKAQLGQMQAAMQQAEQAIAQREAMLQQASEAVQQLQARIQALEADALRREADVTTKTEAERIKAEAAVAVAAIEAQKAEVEVEAGASKAGGEIAEIRQLLTYLATQMRVPMPGGESDDAEDGEDEKPDPEEVMLAQIIKGQQQLAAGQQQTADAIAMLADAVQRPKAITIQRTPEGFQAVAAPAGMTDGR